MADLPGTYDQYALEQELRVLQQKIDDLKSEIFMNPLANKPIDPQKGTLAFSDGTVNWDGSAAAEGLYRYTGSAWVKIG
tara:strand:+ start:542 stop:778 length:237 start_codon:yes stop_codon:yes gene_type:complete